jgi:Spy/CpxP family protein refolding chaperone
MKFRTTFIALALTLISLSAGHAQNQAAPGNGSPGGRRMQMMFKDITLTSTEQVKVDSIVSRYRSQVPPMNQGAPPDSAAMAARRATMQKMQADLRAVLTADQQVTFDKNVAEMRAMMEQRMGRPQR